MSEILRTKYVVTRKPHVCFGCGRKFPEKTKMAVSTIKDGDLWDCYLCPTCLEITSKMRYDDEFGFSELREEALKLEAEEGET